MVSFDHREPGTDPAAWTRSTAGVTAAPVTLDGIGSVVVVAPHPDDETLGAGALVATAADAGVPVHVLLVTRGEGSHPDSPTTTRDDLRRIREDEFRTALRVLHPAASATVLDVPDGGLREHPDVLRDALAARLAGASRPTLVVAPWRGDGHRDHRIAGEVAEAVVERSAGAELLTYPIWAWHWDDPDASAMPWDRARVLAVPADVLDRKRRALDAYRSQTHPLSPAAGDEAIVDERHAAHHLRSVEWFFAPGGDSASATAASRSRESFDAHYERKPEGWDFEGSWYERRKRAVTLAALPRERYRSALELGCATGVLTAALTERADDVLGTDISAAPLERARHRAPAARFVQAALPSEWPAGRWDLVVMSEVGYYLSSADLDATIDRVLASLDDDGVLVACHWRHPDDEAVSSGDVVDGRLAERWPRPALVRHVEEDFVLSVFPGPAVVSVATAERLTP
ncbi:LmbE family N-acetylglucosaminyl deacetylase [Curtobacterium flaccumfaciens]|uniref:LmbE family N-acetylglucosaminyl deacetylase n=1 Tax=Curtobacterium flaccumfaciens TaxID=2035 RepID=A0A4R6DLM5_9MICO|nr:bifunctional PIG-L family deacetylase/class I SAM-dependent methyltransferase [Curtobacterium flaccumfaciens]TDN45805.1 LmbE family N-acetylglucosaminyl deacetylase [Curtobacterium flaccumfaciens]